MKENNQVYWMIIGKKYISLSSDTLHGAKREATKIAKPHNNITIVRARQALARKVAGEWLHA